MVHGRSRSGVRPRVFGLLAAIMCLASGGLRAAQQATSIGNLGEDLVELQEGLERAELEDAERIPRQRKEDEEFANLRDQIAAAQAAAEVSLAEISELEAGAVSEFDTWAMLLEAAELRAGPDGPLEGLAREVQALERTRDGFEAVLRATLVARRRVAAPEAGENLGQELLMDRAPALSARYFEQVDDELAKQMSRSQLELLELETLIAESRQSALGLPEELSALRREVLGRLRGEYRELVRMQQVHLALFDDYTVAAENLRDFVDQQVLWAQSISGGYVPDPLVVKKAFSWLLASPDWLETGDVVLAFAAAHRAEAVGLVFLLLLLALGRRRMRSALADAAVGARGKGVGSFQPTVVALVASAWIVALGPATLWSVSRAFTASPLAGDLHLAAGNGLHAGSVVFATLAMLRGMALKGGLGEAHFRWATETTRSIRRELRWYAPLVIVGITLAVAFEQQGNQAWREDAGRVVYVLQSAALAVFFYRLLGSHTGAAAEYNRRHPEALLSRTRRLWFPLTVLAPVALAVLAFRGYFYSAFEISALVQKTAVLILGLILTNELARRWLWVTRRNLRLEKARQRAEAREGTEDGEAVEDEPDLGALDAQTRQLFSSSVTVAAVVGLWLIWSSMIPALGGLGRVQLWPSFGILPVTESLDVDFEGQAGEASYENYGAAEASDSKATNGAGTDPRLGAAGSLVAGTASVAAGATDPGGELLAAVGTVTLADLAWAILLAALTMIAARNIPALIEIVLLQRLPMDAGSRLAVTTLVRYTIGIVGLTATFGAVGIGWSTVQWMAAALTFGLAFGMQEIFANFVSGLIILIERPVRVGDIVTVDGIEGRVTQLRMRSTTIMDYDFKELLVPNKSFITNSLINWTLSDPVTRIVLKVGIAYGSDTRMARQLMMREARNCTLVLDDPPPRVIFRTFGDNSLEFELRIFIAARDTWAETFDAMHTRIDDAFREAKIEIAFPQRDLHLRSAPALETLRAERDAADSDS